MTLLFLMELTLRHRVENYPYVYDLISLYILSYNINMPMDYTIDNKVQCTVINVQPILNVIFLYMELNI